MRSTYEIKFAYFLNCSNIKWEYEPKTFELIIDGKDMTYTPDFYLPEYDCWIEIKGWWRDNAKLKFNGFIKQHSIINIKVIYKNNLEEMGIL